MNGAVRQGAVAEQPVGLEPSGTVPRQDSRGVHPPGSDAEDSGPWIRVVASATIAYSIFYITWRWLFTLNADALWFAIPLALAETYGLVTACFMTITAWRLKRRSALATPPGLTVDVFVTTYNEPLTVIRKTALAARSLRYPHQTYILDDGKRDEIRALSHELGIGYLRRPNNEHAKAGNLNHALAHTEGDFILQLDADHVPLPTMLDKLLGFMNDERVAFVQSPQDFYNTDAFTYEVNETARRIWEDQQLFFKVIQPGKDRLGAAFFVGSCAVIRRAALHDIGGFATHTITEDIETSLKLHANGWKSVYYGETLAYGLAPGSAAAFHVQHLRWGQGAMQALRRYRIMTMRGLSAMQRIAYFDSLTTYLGGFQRLIFYVAPPLFFLTGTFPVRANALQFGVIFVPYLMLQMLSFKLLARGHGSLLLADRYGMVKFFTHLMAVTGYITRGRLRFHVTPKGVTDVPFRTYAPQLTLALVTMFSVIFAVIAVALGRASYHVAGWGSLAFWVNLVFALWNTVVAVFIVDMSMKLKQKRQDHRYTDTAPVHLLVSREGRGIREKLVGLTDNLNPGGMAVRTMQRIPQGAWVTVQLPLSTGEVEAKGRVVHHRESASRFGAVHTHGIEFVDLPWNDRDAIELHCAHHVTPMNRQRYQSQANAWTATRRWMRDARRAPRTDVGLPARVTEIEDGVERDIGLGLWEDTSNTGARIVIEEPVAINARLRVEIPGTEHTVDGVVVFVRPLETSVGTRFLIGLRGGTIGAQVAAPKTATPPVVVARETTKEEEVWTLPEPVSMPMPATAQTVEFLTPTPSRDVDDKEIPRPKLAEAIAEYLERQSSDEEEAGDESETIPVLSVEDDAMEVARLEADLRHEDRLEADRYEAARTRARAVDAERPSIETPPAVPELEQIEAVPLPWQEVEGFNEPVPGESIMMHDVVESASSRAQETDAALLSVWGGNARMSGHFDIDDSIEIRCDVSGEMNVGGNLIIESGGRVHATVHTANAVIHGVYEGDLFASGIVHIASTGRVSGRLQTDELVIDRGGLFKGSVRSHGEAPDEQASPTASGSPASVMTSSPATRTAARRAKPANGRIGNDVV